MYFSLMLRFSFSGYSVLQRSMSVSKGTSTSRTKDVRSTDLPLNRSLLLNFCVVGIRPPSSATGGPLMFLILSLLLIPLFRGLYISAQLINFSIALPHLYCFIVNVVSRFWSKRLRPFTMFHYSTNPFSDTDLGTSGTLSADSKRTQSQGPCSLPPGKGKDRVIRARKGGGGEP